MLAQPELHKNCGVEERGEGWFRGGKVLMGKRGVLREFREGEAMEAGGCGHWKWRHIAWDDGGRRRRNAWSDLTKLDGRLDLDH